MSIHVALPSPGALGPAAKHQARHILLLPGDVEIDEIETLAQSRFPSTRWDVAPSDLNPLFPAPRTAAPGDPGVLRTSRHTTITGPYLPPPGTPAEAVMAFDVVCPRERGDKPYPGMGDRDGIGRAFPAGLPVREEERVITWLIAAARRLGGSVIADVGGPASAGAVLTPDPGATIDLCVYSDIWLEPTAALALVARVRPQARLATEGEDWQGPPAGIGETPLYHGEQLKPEERREIHAAADEFDIAALTSNQILNGYGITVDLGVDGIIAIEIGGEEQLPILLRDLPWTTNGAVSYRIRWEPEDLMEAQQEMPSMQLRVARSRAAELIAQMAKALQKAAGGEIADESDFLLDPADL